MCILKMLGHTMHWYPAHKYILLTRHGESYYNTQIMYYCVLAVRLHERHFLFIDDFHRVLFVCFFVGGQPHDGERATVSGYGCRWARVCVREREREHVSGCMWVGGGEREREHVSMWAHTSMRACIPSQRLTWRRLCTSIYAQKTLMHTIITPAQLFANFIVFFNLLPFLATLTSNQSKLKHCWEWNGRK